MRVLGAASPVSTGSGGVLLLLLVGFEGAGLALGVGAEGGEAPLGRDGVAVLDGLEEDAEADVRGAGLSCGDVLDRTSAEGGASGISKASLDDEEDE